MAYDARHANKLGIGVVVPSPRIFKNHAFAEDGKWECQICKSDKNCQLCKINMKEVQNLKKNVIELEEEIKKLKSDLNIVCERNTDVKDCLTRER